MADTPESVLSTAAEATPAIWKPALKEAAWAFLAAAVLLVIIYALSIQLKLQVRGGNAWSDTPRRNSALCLAMLWFFQV